MSSGQFITAKLMRTTYETPWGFRLQGGQEFQMPLSVVKVAEGSLAEQAGVQVGDIILKINGKECDKMRHKEAQDAILEAGNYLELYLERGQMNTWQPTVTPVGSMDVRNKSSSAEPQTYTRTSLAKNPEESAPIGSGHNVAPKPFNAPKLVHKQFNSPINLYSEKSLEETLNAHTQVLSTGVQGINFMRPDAPVNKESAVFQMVQEEEARKAKGLSGGSPDKNGFPMDPMAPAAASMDGSMVGGAGGGAPSSGAPIKHVQAPSGGPSPQRQDERNRNICAHCERLIVGVFCRVNNKSFHAECFVCATCGTSLKNIGYFQINDKLYCDIHARQIRQVLGADASGAGGGQQQLPQPQHQPQQQPMGSVGGYANQAPPFGGGGGASTGFNAAAAAGPIGGGGFNNRQFSPSSASSAAPSANPYQPTATTNGFQSCFSSQQGPKKFSPVAPPTAPKPFSPNRNSMCVDLPSTYNYSSSSSQETRSTVQNQNYNAPPAGPAMSNPAANFVSLTIGKRQPQSMATMSQNRPQSCYSSLPSNAYSVTTNTYQTTRTTTNYPMVGGGGPGGFKTNMANPNLTYPPQTATYASRTQTTYSMPNQQSGHPINSLPSQPPPPQAASSYGAAAAPSAGYPASGAMLGRPVQPSPSLSSNPVASNFGKPTSMNDSTKSTAPKRGKGFLQNQLSGGVIPYCGYCSQPIRGQYIMALNKTWCPNHFICANSMCKLSLEQNGFVEEQGRLYCENCYETHFAPTCTKCSLRIKGDCLNALDKKWHPECFTCTHCRRPFGNSSFYLEDAYPYCEKDWNDLFTTKCVGCSLPIAAGDRWVEALNQNYHSNCFRCTVCHNNLEGQSFFAKGGRPFCKAHAR